MKLGTCMYSRVLITNWVKNSRNFNPQFFFFLAQFGPKILKYFVLNETRHLYAFEGAEFKFGKIF